MVVPASGERAEVAPELDPEQRVDADRGLVEEEHGRLVDECAGQREASPLPAGEVHGGFLDTVGQLDHAQRLHDRLPVTDAVGRREEAGVVERR